MHTYYRRVCEIGHQKCPKLHISVDKLDECMALWGEIVHCVVTLHNNLKNVKMYTSMLINSCHAWVDEMGIWTVMSLKG